MNNYDKISHSDAEALVHYNTLFIACFFSFYSTVPYYSFIHLNDNLTAGKQCLSPLYKSQKSDTLYIYTSIINKIYNNKIWKLNNNSDMIPCERNNYYVLTFQILSSSFFFKKSQNITPPTFEKLNAFSRQSR